MASVYSRVTPTTGRTGYLERAVFSYDGDIVKVENFQEVEGTLKGTAHLFYTIWSTLTTNISAGAPSSSNGAAYMNLPNMSRVFNISDSKWYYRKGIPGSTTAGTWTQES